MSSNVPNWRSWSKWRRRSGAGRSFSFKEPEERLKGHIMAELILISPYPRPLQPLVEGALHNELRLLEAGIRRSDQHLQAFEARYGLSTLEFIQRYENDA